MNRLSEFRAAERLLAEQLAQLENMKQDAGLQQDLEFTDKLQALMNAYEMTDRSVRAILSSTPGIV